MKLSRRIGYAVTYYLGTAILKTWRIKNINKEPYNKSRKEGRKQNETAKNDGCWNKHKTDI